MLVCSNVDLFLILPDRWGHQPFRITLIKFQGLRGFIAEKKSLPGSTYGSYLCPGYGFLWSQAKSMGPCQSFTYLPGLNTNPCHSQVYQIYSFISWLLSFSTSELANVSWRKVTPKAVLQSQGLHPFPDPILAIPYYHGGGLLVFSSRFYFVFLDFLIVFCGRLSGN